MKAFTRTPWIAGAWILILGACADTFGEGNAVAGSNGPEEGDVITQDNDARFHPPGYCEDKLKPILESLNITVDDISQLNEAQNKTLEDALEVKAPCLSYTATELPNGKLLPSLEAAYKTFISAADYTGNKKAEARPEWDPTNFHGIEVKARRHGMGHYRYFKQSHMAYFIEVIPFRMREEWMWKELDAEVRNHGVLLATITVRVVDPPASAGKSSTQTEKAKRQVAPPKRFNLDLTTSFTLGDELTVYPDLEKDYMSMLILLARQALEDKRPYVYFKESPLGELNVTAGPVPPIRLIVGNDVLEGLVDLVEWVYEKFHVGGQKFKAAQISMEKSNERKPDERQSAGVILVREI